MESNKTVKETIGKISDVPKLIDELFFIFEDISEINGKLFNITKNTLNEFGDNLFVVHSNFKKSTYKLIEKINNLYPNYIKSDLDYNPRHLKLNPMHSDYILQRHESSYDILCEIYFIFSDVSKINNSLYEIIHYDYLNEDGYDFDSMHTLLEDVLESVNGKIYALDPMMKMREGEILEQWEEIKEENMNFNNGVCTLNSEDLIKLMEGTFL